MRKDFIQTMQKQTAVVAIAPSVLRNQGEGVVRIAQDYCKQIDLSKLGKFNEESFDKFLDRETHKLLRRMKLKHRPWGAARKVLNIFLRDSLNNKYLSTKYKLEKVEPFMEIPLDSVGVKKLKQLAGRGVLPQWPGLKNLDKRTSEVFQSFAQNEADRQGMSRVHLDMYIWVNNR